MSDGELLAVLVAAVLIAVRVWFTSRRSKALKNSSGPDVDGAKLPHDAD